MNKQDHLLTHEQQRMTCLGIPVHKILQKAEDITYTEYSLMMDKVIHSTKEQVQSLCKPYLLRLLAEAYTNELYDELKGEGIYVVSKVGKKLDSFIEQVSAILNRSDTYTLGNLCKKYNIT